jgi:hypothetical protein
LSTCYWQPHVELARLMFSIRNSPNRNLFLYSYLLICVTERIQISLPLWRAVGYEFWARYYPLHFRNMSSESLWSHLKSEIWGTPYLVTERGEEKFSELRTVNVFCLVTMQESSLLCATCSQQARRSYSSYPKFLFGLLPPCEISPIGKAECLGRVLCIDPSAVIIPSSSATESSTCIRR